MAALLRDETGRRKMAKGVTVERANRLVKMLEDCCLITDSGFHRRFGNRREEWNP